MRCMRANKAIPLRGGGGSSRGGHCFSEKTLELFADPEKTRMMKI